MNKRKELVYISHPYGGNINNYERIEEKVLEYVIDNNWALPISPVLMWGHLYHEIEYDTGMEMCLDLLSRCDRLHLCSGWQQSIGCMAEWAFALAKGMPINYEDED